MIIDFCVLRTRSSSLILVLLLSLIAGCKSREMSAQARKITDFRVGQVYELKMHAFIITGTGLVMT